MAGYTSEGIVYTLKVHRDAREDLDAIGIRSAEAKAKIYATLGEIGGSQRLLEALTRKDFGLSRDETFNVDVWGAQQNKGRNLWRLKVWALEVQGIQYRVIYCLDPRVSTYYVLGVLHRDFDYNAKNPRAAKLLEIYDRLGIPSYC